MILLLISKRHILSHFSWLPIQSPNHAMGATLTTDADQIYCLVFKHIVLHYLGMHSRSLFSRILVAIDGSKPSIDAAKSVISLAKSYDAKLMALYVIVPDASFSAYGSTLDYEIVPTIDEISSRFGKRIKHQVQESVDKIQSKDKEKNIEIVTRLAASSNVFGGIIAYSENESIDLIVVGTRGTTGFKRLLLGSVASGIIAYAHCPVLVVK
jgi:nucleotide-binding universal stress UspA family protein